MRGMQATMFNDGLPLKTLGIALLLIGCLSFIVWMSAAKLLSIQDSKDQIKDTINLSQHVSLIHSQYLDQKPESLESELQQANQLLIQDFTHLAQWAQELQREGKQSNLQMNYRILKTKQSPALAEGLTVIPIQFHVSARNNSHAYRSYLQFLQSLEQSGPRVDIHEVTVIGDGEQATELTVGLSLWMKATDSVEL